MTAKAGIGSKNETVISSEELKDGEYLDIVEFFVIKKFSWGPIKNFNIFTGKMASGKSLCVKLLFFFERVFQDNFFLGNFNKNTFNEETLYKNIEAKFTEIFKIYDQSGHNISPEKRKLYLTDKTSLKYVYKYGDHEFDLSVKQKNDKLVWKSEYINKNIKKWHDFFDGVNSVDAAEQAKNRIANSLKQEFDGTFPINTLFIPAGRGAATLSRISDSRDPLVKRFMVHEVSFIKGEEGGNKYQGN
jgi:hypothetical protein